MIGGKICGSQKHLSADTYSHQRSKDHKDIYVAYGSTDQGHTMSTDITDLRITVNVHGQFWTYAEVDLRITAK